MPVEDYYAGLISTEDIMRRQRAADAERAARLARSSLAGLTLRTGLEDLRAAATGVPRDLVAGESLWTSLTTDDRLRGLGIACVALGLLGLALW